MSRFGIGQPVRRVEDQRFLTGRARFLDDMQLPHTLHRAVVLPRARGRAARAAGGPRGVALVLAGGDLKREGLGGIPPLFMPEDMGGPKGYRTFRPLLGAAEGGYAGAWGAGRVAG